MFIINLVLFNYKAKEFYMVNIKLLVVTNLYIIHLYIKSLNTNFMVIYRYSLIIIIYFYLQDIHMVKYNSAINMLLLFIMVVYTWKYLLQRMDYIFTNYM